MNYLQEIQNWYHSECNDEWEHVYGITIDTLDNPGWTVSIDLYGTSLQNSEFQKIEYGYDNEVDSDEWFICEKKESKFIGNGGPHKLEEIIKIFIEWKNEEKTR